MSSEVNQATMYIVGSTYTRNDIYSILRVPENKQAGDWLNGYHRHESSYYIFCNVGIASQTGHDYDNHWEGETLVWHGKTDSHFGQTSIKNLISGEYRILIFYRTKDRDPFTYAGEGTPIPHRDVERPARIDWVFGSEKSTQTPVYTDEYAAQQTFTEGRRLQVYVNRHERDRRARDACIRQHGTECSVCDLDFGARYGELGRGFIHVHHVVPLSELGHNYVVDPATDLVPVCPNCHAMLHRANPPLTVAVLRKLLLQMKPAPPVPREENNR